MPFVYILQCADGTFYTGWTHDLDARVAAHNSGVGARYTRGRRPVHLAYWEAVRSRGEALRREASIRRLGRAGKSRLVSPMPDLTLL